MLQYLQRHQTLRLRPTRPRDEMQGDEREVGGLHFGKQVRTNDDVAMHAVIVSVKMGAMRA